MDDIKKAEEKIEEATDFVKSAKLKRVIELHDTLGQSFAEIGQEFGLTRGRIKQLYDEGKLLEKEKV